MPLRMIFFVLLIFSISFKICYSVLYCKVSPLHSGNCHFKHKQQKIFHSSNKKTRISISFSALRDLTERLIDMTRRSPVSVHESRIAGQAAASALQGSVVFPRGSHLRELKLLRCKLTHGSHSTPRNVFQFLKQILKKEPNPKQANARLKTQMGSCPTFPPAVNKG